MADRSFLAELKVPAHEDFVPVAKMVAASLGGMLGFGLEEVDELKIAVAQAFDTIQQEAEELWGANGTLLRLAYSSTGQGIAVDVEAIGPATTTAATASPEPRPAGRQLTPPATSRQAVPPAPSPAQRRALAQQQLEAERALQRDMIRLFVDDFRQQVDSGRGQFRVRMVKYLIS
ncbi:MAG TPA: hypothetical protein VFA92_01480 [Candidatus Binatia bacterium]|jgi:hypothetical protein|nr:hypothetical protein [Candidatus Binatia bacterium]